MIYCYLTDCNCKANYKNASRNSNFAVPAQKKELYPTKLPSFKREDATLSEDKENIPPANDEAKDSQRDLNQKEGYDAHVHK